MPGWVLLRQKIRIVHTDPVNRTFESELTFRNDSAEQQTELPIEIDRYRPGLSVRGASGQELGYLPGRIIRERLAAEGEPDPNRWTRILAVSLTDAVPSLGLAVVRLHFQDVDVNSESASFRPTRPFTDWLIRTPEYNVTDPAPGVVAATRVVEIHGPVDTVIKPSWTGLPADPDPEIYAGEDRGSWIRKPRFVFARIPAGIEGATCNYKVDVLSSERDLLMGIFLGLLAVPVATWGILVVVPQFECDLLAWTLGSPSPEFARQVALLGITATLAIIAFLRPVWVNRAAFGWPLLANLWLLFWTRNGPNL